MPRKSLQFNRKADLIYPGITSQSYCDYDTTKCLIELYSADHIIDRMKYDKHSITKNLESWENEETSFNPLEKVLSIDDHCLCTEGWGERPFVNKNFCVGCELLRRISKGMKTPEDGIIPIETGRYIGNKYIINNIKGYFSKFSYDENSKKINDKLSLNVELKMNSNLKYYSTNSAVTNYISICCFIINKLSKSHFPTIPLYEWAYQCNKNVIIIENHPNLGVGNLDFLMKNPEYNKAQVSPTAKKFQALSLKSNVMISILKQLISTLHYLSEFGFSHGAPSLSYLSFSRKPVHYKYDGADIISPLTVHLLPSYNASINIEKDLRIFTKGFATIHNESTIPVEIIDYFVGHKKTIDYQVPLNIIPLMKELDENLVLGYKIGSKANVFNELVFKKGIQFFSTSFDFYNFLCSLLTEDAFFSSFIENEELSFAWTNLWKSSEFPEINEKLKIFRNREHNEPITFDELYNLISNYTLREDGLNYFWNSIKNL